MSNFFIQMFQSFKAYLYGSHWDFEFFIYITGAFLVVFLISLFVLSVFIRRREALRLRVFKIFRIAFIACCVTLFAIVAIISTFLVTGVYYTHPLQFSHLLAFGLICILLSVLLAIFAGQFRGDQIKSLTGMPATRGDENDKRVKLSKGFTRMKLWYLLPMLGFLFLLLIYFQPKNLISIVLDNSDTMLETANKGESKYETARDALAGTIGHISMFNHFVVTTIDRKGGKHDYATIMGTTDFSKLRGISQYFDNASSALNYINSIPIGGDSPITEIIYSNLLFIQKTIPIENYTNIYLLIITDCRENGCLLDLQASKNYLCKDAKFNNIFSGDQVTLIDLEGNFANRTYMNNPDLVLMQRCIDCGFSIEDGSSEDSYEDALKGVLQKFFFDWHLIAWVLFFYLLNGVFVILIHPKNR